MKKVEVYLVSKMAGDVYLIRGEGELFFPDVEIEHERTQTAIFHAKHYSPNARENWYTVNLWTGLFVTGGNTKKKCLEEFEKIKTRYLTMLNDLNNFELYLRRHEELEKLKKA